MGESEPRGVAVARFEDLVVWQKARDLSLAVYGVTRRGPFSSDFGLRDQIQQASVSAMSNIAEGFERYSRPDFMRFLAIARGSVAEVRSQLILAHCLRYISDEEYESLRARCMEVGRLIGALRGSIAKKQNS